eukprot:3272079-Rhodomonas_salina.1
MVMGCARVRVDKPVDSAGFDQDGNRVTVGGVSRDRKPAFDEREVAGSLVGERPLRREACEDVLGLVGRWDADGGTRWVKAELALVVAGDIEARSAHCDETAACGRSQEREWTDRMLRWNRESRTPRIGEVGKEEKQTRTTQGHLKTRYQTRHTGKREHPQPQNGDATREAPILDAPPFGDSSGSIPVQLATKKKKFAFPPVNATSPDCFINVTSARHGSCPQYGVRHRTVVGESGARFEGDVAVNPSA